MNNYGEIITYVFRALTFGRSTLCLVDLEMAWVGDSVELGNDESAVCCAAESSIVMSHRGQQFRTRIVSRELVRDFMNLVSVKKDCSSEEWRYLTETFSLMCFAAMCHSQ